jgi:hypothetical protein
LAKQAKRHRYDLVLEVFDSQGGARLVQVRHRVHPNRSALSEQAAASPPTPPGRVSAGPERDRPEQKAAAAPPSPLPERGRHRERPVRSESKHRGKIRKCRLSHYSAVPEDEGVELESELDCGRLLFLDHKSAKRLVHVADLCRRSADGVLTVEVELACRKKKLKVEIWAEFFDAEGRGVNRTGKEELHFRQGRIRTVVLGSVLPADKVVVFVEKD